MVEATTYRAKALRLRSEAERMADAHIKRRLLDIAQQYDDLARLVAASYLRVVNSWVRLLPNAGNIDAEADLRAA
jgi:hypothetical protein